MLWGARIACQAAGMAQASTGEPSPYRLLSGAITQDPVGMGEELVKAAVAAINGDELPESIDTGFYWYDETNIDDPEIRAVLYE